MLSKNELIDAIERLEDKTETFQDCQKLATFYLLYDHLYSVRSPGQMEKVTKLSVIGNYGESEFLGVVSGMDADKVFPVLDELMDTIKVLQPRLYDATLTRLMEF